MYKEGMLQSIIRPFLFFLGYGEVFQVYIRMCNTGTATVIIQQFLCRRLPLLPGACRFYFLQTRINPNLSVQKPPALVAVRLQQQQA